MKFNVGQEVVLVGVHTCNQSTYTKEATDGSIGIIKDFLSGRNGGTDRYSIIWSFHPEGFRDAGNGSVVNESCLRSNGPTDEEIAEVFKSLGVSP